MDNYFESDEFREVLASYEEALANGESPYLDADDFTDVADYYLSCDRPDDAMKAVNRGLRIHPGDEVLLCAMSSIYVYTHRYDDARKCIEDNELSGNDILYQKAQLVYAIDNDRELAEQMFRKWMENEIADVSAKDLPNVERESYVHIISSFVELHDNSIENEQDYALIHKWIVEYIEKFQPLGKYEHDVSVADFCRNNYLADLLVRALTQILDENPYLPHGWSILALGYFTLENYEQAIEASDFALAIDPNDNDALLTRAYCHNYLDQKDVALQYFDRYWELENKDLVQGIPYADCLASTGDKAKAMRMLLIGEEALLREKDENGFKTEERRKRYLQAMSDLIGVYQSLERYEDCERCVSYLLEIEPFNAEFVFMQGNYQLAQQKIDEALASYSQAICEADDKVMMSVDIALTMVLNNYDDSALEVLEAIDKMLIKSPQKSPSVKNLPAVKALTYLKLGQSDLFLSNFKKAVEVTPDLIKNIFGGYFPEDLSIEDYYDFALNTINKIGYDSDV